MKLNLLCVGFFVLSAALLVTSCKKEKAATPPATGMDTFINSGKEFLFFDQAWQNRYDAELDKTWNYISVKVPNSIFNPERKVEVSILFNNSTVWTIIQRASHPMFGGTSLGYGWLSTEQLEIYRVYAVEDNNLYRTKASIKVKFF